MIQCDYNRSFIGRMDECTKVDECPTCPLRSGDMPEPEPETEETDTEDDEE